MKSSARAVFALAALGLLVGSCVSNESPTGVGADAYQIGLAIQPALIPSPADADALPINRIRAVTARADDNVVLADTMIEVSPSESEWDVTLKVVITSESLDVVVFLYLINEAADGTQEVQFSGKTDRITIAPGQTTEPADVPLVRGPLANLFTTSVTIGAIETVMIEGKTQTLVASSTTSSTSTQPTVFWTSLDPTVLTVTGSIATALQAGTVEVVASAGAFADTVSILVIVPPVDSVLVSPDSADVVVGTTSTYAATLFDADGNVLTGRPVAWSTADAGVATVDPVTGVVTAVSLGSTTVTAASEGVSDDAVVVVVPVPVAEVLVLPDSAEVEVGSTVAYSAQTFDPVGTELFGRVVVWSTGSAGIAMVDQAGVVTGVAAGTTGVTATSEGASDDAIVVVRAAPTALALGVAVEADISAAGEIDEYTFSGVPDDIVSVALGQVSGFSPATVQASVVAPSGAPLVSVSANSQSEFTLTESGTYRIQVTSSNFVTTGSYGIGVEGIDLPSGDAAPVTVGDAVLDSIVSAADVDEFTFSGSSGDIMSVALGQVSGFSPATVRASVFAPSGALVGNISANTQPELTLTETGTHVIQVSSSNYVTTGSYGIGVEGASPPSADAQPITIPGATADSIVIAADVDEFTFSGTASDIVTVALNQVSGFSPATVRASVFAPSGTLVGNVSANTQPQFTLTETGTHVIQVSSSNFTTAGTYSLALSMPGAAGVNTWTALGGLWSTPSNWSLGRAPIAGDTVQLTQGVDYLVTLDVNPTIAKLTIGGAGDFITLNVGDQTLTITDAGASPGLDILPLGALQVADGTVTVTAFANNGSVRADGGFFSLIASTVINAGQWTVATGSSLIVSHPSSNDFQTSGTLTVESGASLIVGANANVTFQGGSIDGTGVVQFSPATLLILDADLVLDGPEIQLDAAATVASGADRLTIGPASTLLLNSTSGQAETNTIVVNQGDVLAVGPASYLNDSLYVEAGATVVVDGTGSGSLLGTWGVDNSGTISLIGTGDARFGPGSPTGQSITNRPSGYIALLSGGNRFLNGELINEGTVSVQAPTELARRTVQGADVAAQHLNSGTIDLVGGDLTVVLGGTSPSFTNAGTITVGAATTLSMNSVSNGVFTNAVDGLITGFGTVDVTAGTPSVTNLGRITPGPSPSPGMLSWQGALPLGATSLIDIELEGAVAGTGYDQLNIGGSVTLDGALVVDTLNGFTPTIGDRYAVMTFVSRTGAFLGVTLPSIEGVALDTVWAEAGTVDTLFIAATPMAPQNLNRWLNGSGGSWMIGSNWSKGVVPVSTDSVVVDLDGTYPVVLGQAAAVASLTIGGGTGIQTVQQAFDATLTVSGDIVVTSQGAYQLVSGTLSAGPSVTMNGTFFWQGGTLALGGAMTVGSTTGQFTLGGSTVLSAGTIDNLGTFAWTSGAGILFQNGATLRNGNVMNITTAGVFGAGIGGGTFVNDGTVNRNAAGVTTFQIDATNNGLVDLQAGTWQFVGTLVNNDTIEVDAGAILDLDGDATHTAGALLRGEGTIDVDDMVGGDLSGDIAPGTSPGTLTWFSDYDPSPTHRLLIELAGNTPGSYDVLNITGQTDATGTFAGTLVIDTLNFVPAVGDTIPILTFDSRTSSFSSVTFPTLAGVTLDTLWTDDALGLGDVDTLYVIGRPPAQALVQWTNPVGGNWSLGSNWSTGSPPAVGDSVVIDLDGTYPVTLDADVQVAYLTVGAATGTQTFQQAANTLTVDNLAWFLSNSDYQLTGGTLSGAGPVLFGGGFTWGGGTMNGGGVTTVSSAATSVWSGSPKTLDNRLLINEDTVAWSGGSITLANSAAISNLGSVERQGAGNLTAGAGGGIFSNDGLFRKTGTGTSAIAVDFQNTDSTSVEGGTLQFTGDGSHTGAFGVSAGATLDFSGGTHGIAGNVGGAGVVDFAGTVALLAGATFSSPGLIVTGGSTLVNGSLAALDSIRVFNGSLALETPATAVTVPRLYQGGASTLYGADSVIVTSSWQWDGGVLFGSGAMWIQGTATGSWAGSPRTLNIRSLQLDGDVTWSGANTTFLNGATLINTATLSRTSTLTASFLAGTDGGTFTNTGTFLKSGTGVSNINIGFDNDGSVDHQGGTLNLGGTVGGTHTGSFGVASGALLTVTGGTHSFGGDMAGAGTVTFSTNSTIESTSTFSLPGLISTGASLTVNGTLSVSDSIRVAGSTVTLETPATAVTVPRLSQSTGGTVTGADSVIVTGSWAWAGGTQSGSGVTWLQNTAFGVWDSGLHFLNDSRQIVSDANVTWTVGNVQLSGTASVVNNGTMSQSGTSSVSFTGSGAGFTNDGLFRNLGTGAMGVNVAFVNNSVIEVAQLLDVNGNFTHAAGASVRGQGTLDLAGATVLAFDGNVDPGTSPGQLDLVAPAGGLGTGDATDINIEIGGTARGILYDALDIAGDVTLAGDLLVDTVFDFTPSAGNRFAVMTFTSRSANFANVVLPTVTGLVLDTVWAEAGSVDTLFIDVVTAPTPTPYDMIFTSESTGSNEIWKRSADGRTLTQLTNTGGSTTNWDAEWSPDGTEIIFTTFRDGQNDHVWIMNADGSAQTELTSNAQQNVYPSWSPDGTQVVFATNSGVSRNVYTMDSDGTNVTQLTNSGAEDSQPTWSPSGSEIAFFSNRTGTWQLFTMTSAGANETNRSNNSAYEYMPAWSPDGTRVAFVSNRYDPGDFNGWEIYVMDMSDFSVTRLTNSSAEDLQPAWTPDSSQIVFSSDATGSQELYIMNADGSNQRRLTTISGADQFPSILPGG